MPTLRPRPASTANNSIRTQHPLLMARKLTRAVSVERSLCATFRFGRFCVGAQGRTRGHSKIPPSVPDRVCIRCLNDAQTGAPAGDEREAGREAKGGGASTSLADRRAQSWWRLIALPFRASRVVGLSCSLSSVSAPKHSRFTDKYCVISGKVWRN